MRKIKRERERKNRKIERDPEDRRRWPPWKPWSFCNLISEVIFHHFCHILVTRGGSISPDHSQGERIAIRGVTKREGPLGPS